MVSAPPRQRRRASRFRIDIEGLRAVAILAVVGYHAHVGFLSGGYVGVDVFFVVSGYLITDLLWRELRQHGRLSFTGFYGRRMRRLLPASMLVLAVTAVASAQLLPPLQAKSVLTDGIACALYVGNYRFAATQTNYLAATSAASPFQHYWSLGVEEQFYLVWPFLLALAAGGLVAGRAAHAGGRARRASGRHRRRGVGATPPRPSRHRAVLALVAVWVVSLILSLWLTRVDQPWAFFSLPTRAWELATGGLVALGVPLLRRLRWGLAAAVGWGGLGAVVIAAVVFNGSTAFPGVAALLPVLGSAGILVAGGVDRNGQGLVGERLATARRGWVLADGPVAVLGRRVPRFIGRISYSWYLWHWPVLILAPYVVGHPLDVWADVGLAAGSGCLAVATFVLVENPARAWRWAAAMPRRALSSGAMLTAAGACVCVVAALLLPSLKGHGVAPVAVVHTPPPVATQPAGKKTTPTTQNPAFVAATSATDQVAAAVSHSVSASAVPSNLNPPLADASSSEAPPFVDGCLDAYTDDAIPTCQFGDTSSNDNVVLFGDSHADMWFPAIDSMANAHHWRLSVISKAACPPLFISLYSPVLGRQWTECSQWQDNALQAIRADHPSLVVMAIAPKYDSAYHVVQDGPSWLQGLTTMITDIRQTGSRVVLLGPIPAPPADVPACLSAHLDDVGACNIPVTQPSGYSSFFDGIDLPGMTAEAGAATKAGAFFIDTERWFCTATTCPVIVDNLLVYRDDSHITVPYADYLTPAVTAEIDKALEERA